LLDAGASARRDLEWRRLRRAARIAHDQRVLAGDPRIALARLVLRLADRARISGPMRLMTQTQPSQRVPRERVVGLLGADPPRTGRKRDRAHQMGRLAAGAAGGISDDVGLAAAAHAPSPRSRSAPSCAATARRRAWIASISARVSSCGRL